jgi:predicted enzyme related to lactoylglutathione lyase
MVLTSDTARSKTFYSELLGFEVVDPLSSPAGDFVYLHSKAGGTDIALQDASKQDYGVPQARGGIILSFAVDDADAVYSDWQSKSVEFLSEVFDMGAGRMFTAKDPDGNYVSIYHLHPQVLEMRKQMEQA